MKWSWKLGEVAGIGIFMHATFLILLVWIGLSHWHAEQNVIAVAEGVSFILALFACVVLHELGHALAAQRYGIQTRDITLLPIGGIARLERIPEDPRQELIIAIAGPLVNVVIAVALLFGLVMSGNLQSIQDVTATGGSFLTRLMLVNIVLVIFNMLPAFPMDGGRVLRALLATQIDYARATQFAATIGQTLAIGLGFLGLMSNPFLVLIAVFVWVGAAYESTAVTLRSAIRGLTIKAVLQTHFETLSSQSSVNDAVDLTLNGSQKDFPVLDHHGEVIGVLTQSGMLKALTSTGPDTLVVEAMQNDVKTVSTDEQLESLLSHFEEGGCQTVIVIDRDQIVGIVTLDNLSEFLRIQQAINSSRTRV